MRDNEKILKVLRNKNFSNEYNMIYDNISAIKIENITNSSLKDAHKKILIWYKNLIDQRNILMPSPEQMDDIKDSISYGNMEDPVGKVYSVNSYDSYHSNVLIPYGSEVFNIGNRWMYKHIALNKGHPTDISYRRDEKLSDYKNGINKNIQKNNPCAEIIQIGNDKQNTPSSNLSLRHGVKFY